MRDGIFHFNGFLFSGGQFQRNGVFSPILLRGNDTG
jgi:hypothetical protein